MCLLVEGCGVDEVVADLADVLGPLGRQQVAAKGFLDERMVDRRDVPE
jgi:hypothetical protein